MISASSSSYPIMTAFAFKNVDRGKPLTKTITKEQSFLYVESIGH